MSVSVFVYGTLLFPEVTQRLGIVSNDQDGRQSSVLRRVAARLRGYQRFTVRLRQRGNFPAILRASSEVSGELLLDVSKDSLQRMDLFECIDQGLYVFESVTVQVADVIKPFEAHAYVAGSALVDKLDGPWDPDEFRRNDLEWYLQNVVG